MRLAIGFLFLSSLAIAAQTQAPAGPLEVPVKVRTLTIVSNDVSQEFQQNIVRAYQGQTYSLAELEERIRQGLRDLGYAQASVEIPQIATMPAPAPGQSVDVTVRVSARAIYRLSKIRFENTKVFPADQLRSQFPIANGSVFNATFIGKGLDNLKNLYQSQGYITFGAIPRIQEDEVQHILALTIDISEGGQYFFGRLLFNGVEPRAGAAQALLAAWKPLEGKVYNLQTLAQWLKANATFLPDVQTAPEKYVSSHIEDGTYRIDIELEFP